MVTDTSQTVLPAKVKYQFKNKQAEKDIKLKW